jgi:hypothetical protein
MDCSRVSTCCWAQWPWPIASFRHIYGFSHAKYWMPIIDAHFLNYDSQLDILSIISIGTIFPITKISSNYTLIISLYNFCLIYFLLKINFTMIFFMDSRFCVGGISWIFLLTNPNCFGVSWPKILHIILHELNLFAHQIFASSIQSHQLSSIHLSASCSAIIYPWLFPIPHPLPFIISCSIKAKLSQNSMGNSLESLLNPSLNC